MVKPNNEKLEQQMERLGKLMSNMSSPPQQYSRPMNMPPQMPIYGMNMMPQMPMNGMNNNMMMQHMMRMEMMLRDIFITVHEIYRVVLELKEHELED